MKSYPVDGDFGDVVKDALGDVYEMERLRYGGFDLSLPENAGLKKIVTELAG